jgi:hypothetical protein
VNHCDMHRAACVKGLKLHKKYNGSCLGKLTIREITLFSGIEIGIIGKFRTKMITITNTSSLCGYVRQSRDVIFGRFAGVLVFHFRTFQTNIILFIFFDLLTCSPWKCSTIWLFEFFGTYAYCPWVYAW